MINSFIAASQFGLTNRRLAHRLQQSGRRLIRYEVNQQHFSAARLHELGPHYLVDAVIGAFDEKIRAQSFNQRHRRILFEDNNQRDAFDGAEDFGSRDLRLNGSRRTLQSFDRGV